MIHQTISRLFLALFLICGLSVSSMVAFAQTNTAITNATEISDAQAALRANLLVQEQLHSALRAIEQARQDADSASKRNAEIFSERLSALEKTLAEQRRNDLESLRDSNRLVLTAASILGAVGILALLCTAYFQVRAMNRVAEVGALISATVHESPRALGESKGTTPAQLGEADQSNERFMAAIEQLEKKIRQLDSVNSPTVFSSTVTKINAPNSEHAASGSNGAGNSEIWTRVNLLLTEGQALLDGGDAENALVYFEQALDLDPNNTEALIKKGTTLESLRKMPEALAAYDRAIATDSSITVAYLYKGGVLNRLQRFAEAMECYEQALKTQPKSAA